MTIWDCIIYYVWFSVLWLDMLNQAYVYLKLNLIPEAA
jgi:hypothetical protein